MALRTEQLTLRRATETVLHDVSIRIAPGELVGLLGANGAGKSTLLAALAGELAAHGGSVYLDQDDISCLTPSQQARRRAVLPQNPSLNFDLGVAEVVAMGAYPFPELSPDQVEQLSQAALATADIAHLATRRYVELSGGEQQRVQFARVLVQCHAQPSAASTRTSTAAPTGSPTAAPTGSPTAAPTGSPTATPTGSPTATRTAASHRYVLLDEPIASLDPKHQIALMRAAQSLAHTQNMGVMVILHDINLAARWCDRLILLADTRVAASGSPEEVLTAAHLSTVFDIEADVLAHPTAPGRLLILPR